LTSFFGELKRRNVVKVAVAYAIVGWILVEVSSTVLPIFEAPDWIVQVLTFFVILGFPLALILSWAYEITPEGIKLERNVAAGESITHITGRKIDFAIIGALLVAVGFLVVNYVLVDSDQVAVVQETTPTVEPAAESPAPVVVEAQREVLPNSVAVLPFENMSTDPADEFYAAGIHEEILNQLVKLSALNVIARTSMRQYANTEKSIPEIARELNVETVMEGSVRYANGQIRITTQLNDGVTGAHLWSETYTRDFDDIFAIESDVAMNVANAVGAEFSLEEQASIEKIPTDSPEAYALYLRALETTERAARQALLDRAIDIDPEFALAYATKAGWYAGSIINTVANAAADPAEHNELEALVRENAAKALSLDPNLGQAHAALAITNQVYWRWAEAEESFERALRASPNDARVLGGYSWFKSFSGEHATAFQLGLRAMELDPDRAGSHRGLGFVLLRSRQPDAAVAVLRDAIRLNPRSALAHMFLGHAEAALGNGAEALNELRHSERLGADNPPLVLIAETAYGYAQLGRREDVVRRFNELEAIPPDTQVGAGSWALAYLALGEYDKVLDWLRVAVEKIDNREPDEGFYNLMFIKSNIYFDPILDEPRFQELLSRIGSAD